MDINKMTDTLEPEETGVGGLQLPGKDRVVFRPSERKSLLEQREFVRGITVKGIRDLGGMKMWKKPHSLIKMTLEVVYQVVDKIKAKSTVIQVEAKRLIQVDLIVIFLNVADSQTTEERSARYASTSHAERDTPSRSSKSSDHRRSRRDSPDYDRHQGRVVLRRHIVMIGIIETVQNRHFIMEDMKVQGELLDPMDIIKMTDTLEPEETGVGGLQLPGKDQKVKSLKKNNDLLDMIVPRMLRMSWSTRDKAGDRVKKQERIQSMSSCRQLKKRTSRKTIINQKNKHKKEEMLMTLLKINMPSHVTLKWGYGGVVVLKMNRVEFLNMEASTCHVATRNEYFSSYNTPRYETQSYLNMGFLMKMVTLEFCFTYALVVERQTRKKLKCIRSANGGEYIAPFDAYCREHGIQHQKTSTETPQLNGLGGAENITLLRDPDVCFHHAGLACFFLGVWSGKDVSYHHLRVFGCKASVHIPKDERSKLDVKNKPCVFLGYGQDELGYRLYDPVQKKLVRSRDVEFDEDQTLKDVEKTEKETIPQHNDDPIDLDPVPPKHFDAQFGDDIQNDEEQNDEEHGADDVDAQEQPNLDEDVHPELPVPMPPFVPLRRWDLVELSLVWASLELEEEQMMSRQRSFWTPWEELPIEARLEQSFAMKDLGRSKITSLALRIFLRDRGAKKFLKPQEQYIEKVLRRFNMDKAKVVSSPLTPNFKLTDKDCPSSKKNIEKILDSHDGPLSGWYLMYAMVCNKAGFKLMLVLSVISCQNPKPMLVGYTDLDLAGNKDNMKSTSGYLMTFAGGAVSWQSRLQKCVALSTTEAEYVAATEACKELLWLKRFLQELGFKQQRYAVLCDNQSTIHLAKNSMFHKRTKHIDIRYHWIRDAIEDARKKDEDLVARSLRMANIILPKNRKWGEICWREESKKRKKEEDFRSSYHPNPAAVLTSPRSFGTVGSSTIFCTEASLNIKEGFDRWDLDFEAWKFCFLPGQIASCLVIFFLSCSLFVAIYLDIDSKIMMIVVCL
ncbi:retrovirus-related pol polyprotein from transposon TNT 1-94 [Tanacetum coccineum]